MKISIYNKGRAWSFGLAAALSRTDNLDFLVTSYPKFYAKKYNIPGNKIKSIFIIEIFLRLLRKFDPLFRKLKLNFDSNLIMDWVADTIFSIFFIQNSNFFILGFGNSTCKIIKKAKKKNIKTIYFLNTLSPKFLNKYIHIEYNKLGLESTNYSEFLSLTRKTNESIKMADYTGALSSFQKQTYIDDGFDESKMFICPLGVDPVVFFPKKIKKDKFIVFFVGNSFVRKGLKYLIEAFNSLKLDNSELWIAGHNPKSMAEKVVKLEKNNIFLGHVNEFKLPDLYNQASIFCFPTHEEGFGAVILQAMACALPVITTPYCRDAITDGQEGFIIEPGKSSLISEKIKFFYDNPNKVIEMGAKARTKVEKEFTYDCIAKRIVNFCNSKSI